MKKLIEKIVHGIREALIPFWKKPLRIAVLLILLISWIVFSYVVYDTTINPRYTSESMGITDDVRAAELTKDVTLTQTFQADKDIDGVSILLATFERTNTSHYHIIIDDTSNIIRVFDKTIDAADFADNSYYNLAFNSAELADDDAQYMITITSSDAVAGNAVTVWSSSNDEYAKGGLTLNGQLQSGDIVFTTTTIDPTYSAVGLLANRLMLVTMFFVFLMLHVIFDLAKMYDWIFRRRLWLALALIFFMVINQYSFSSITMYDGIIQPNQGSEYVEPIFGVSRPIRSDEWLVGTPMKLSAQYTNYAEYNDILRAEKSTNLSASGLYLSYSALARPLDWGYFLFGAAYGLSFFYSAFIVITLLVSFELCLIISKQKRLIALLGAALITFSSYFLWWSFVSWIMTGQAALVCIYYFMHAKNRWTRAVSGFGLAIFGAYFITALYPAWQVPAGYLYLGILVWMLVSDRAILKKFSKLDWGILILSLVFLASIVISYFRDSMEYMNSIMDTVYPGDRVSYGGFSINKLFYYLQSLLYPVKNFSNPCEPAGFLNFYPIPTILAIYLVIKKKGKDLLTMILLGVSLLLTLYCVIELPPVLAKVLLLTYSQPSRLVDIVGFVQVYLLVAALSRFDGIKKMHPLPAGILAIATVGTAAYYCHTVFPTYLSLKQLVVVSVVFIIVCILLLTDISIRKQHALLIGIICVTILSGLLVNPIVKGLDVIYSKPIAKEIEAITDKDPDAKWITLDNLVDSGFLVACGAPTINSVNYIPNYQLWKILDPQGKYNDSYNRYAHIIILLTADETSVDLNSADLLTLNLSYKNMDDISVKYIFCRRPLYDNEFVDFVEEYADSGYYIYSANYK